MIDDLDALLLGVIHARDEREVIQREGRVRSDEAADPRETLRRDPGARRHVDRRLRLLALRRQPGGWCRGWRLWSTCAGGCCTACGFGGGPPTPSWGRLPLRGTLPQGPHPG